MKLQIFIQGQTLNAYLPQVMVADTVNYFRADFVFKDEVWKNLTKYAHFQLGEECYDIPLQNDSIPESAGLNLKAGSWSMRIHGDRFEDGELVQRITTNACFFTVQESGCLDGSAFPSVPPDLAAELLARVVELEQNGGSGGTGADGKSAYEIALEHGFEGSEQEWLESLKGEDGATTTKFVEAAYNDGVYSLVDATYESILADLAQGIDVRLVCTFNGVLKKGYCLVIDYSKHPNADNRYLLFTSNNSTTIDELVIKSDGTIRRDVGRVVTEAVKVNGHQLNADINLTASDVGAYSKEEVDTKIKSVENKQEEIVTEKQVVSTVTSGAYINPVDWTAYEERPSENYAYAVAVVKDNARYSITCCCVTSFKWVVMFRDESGALLSYIKPPVGDWEQDNTFTKYIELEIDVPDGAYDIVINSYTNSNNALAIEPSVTEITERTILVNKNLLYSEQELSDEEKEQARKNIEVVSQNVIDALEYDKQQLERRVLNAEKYNDFTWGTFDKAYFVFVHDDTNAFLSTAYNAFHAENAPLSGATVVSRINNVIDGKTAKEWLELIVDDGGEVLMHYDADLKNDSTDEIWRYHIVEPKQVLENEGFEVRGLILANSSDARSVKGEKFCRYYYDYADKVGTSERYNLGRTLMLQFANLDAFVAHIDTCASTAGLYAFGFHGLRNDESWITEESLKSIIQHIRSKENTEITTYSVVFDKIGTTVLEKRIVTLEQA